MRRRTADFLQGEPIVKHLKLPMLKTFHSTQQSQTRERREREKDSQRTHFQSTRIVLVMEITVNVLLTMKTKYHACNANAIWGDKPKKGALNAHANAQTYLQIQPLGSQHSRRRPHPSLVLPRTLKLPLLQSPNPLPLQLRPPLRTPVLLLQLPKLRPRLRFVHRRQPHPQHLQPHIPSQQPSPHIHSSHSAIILIPLVDIRSNAAVQDESGEPIDSFLRERL